MENEGSEWHYGLKPLFGVDNYRMDSGPCMGGAKPEDMRQLMSTKNAAKYAKKLGLPIVKILVRGGTGHRKDLCMEDGSIVCLWPDGTMDKNELVTWK